MSVAASIRFAVSRHWRGWLAVAASFLLLVNGAQLLALMLRFGELPNYVTWYDWPGNVARIVRATPSIVDIASIASNEWLVEVGYMNHDYGNGISEWSFELLPANLLFVTLIAALLATNWCVIRHRAGICEPRDMVLGTASAGAAGLLAAITSVTVSWVACCGVPSWITGLSILGLGFSTAQSLKPFGAWFDAAALVALTTIPLVLAQRPSQGARVDR